MRKHAVKVFCNKEFVEKNNRKVTEQSYNVDTLVRV